MAVRKILTIPDNRLYKISVEVTEFDKKLRDQVRDMFDSMRSASGVGLAGVQIGILKRIMVIDLEEAGFIKGVFINPVIEEKSEETQEGEEGCLSVPGITAPLLRPKWIKLSYQNLAGKRGTIEAEMLFARAVLHEMDHMDGKVFIDLLEPDIKKSLKNDIELVKKGKLPSSYNEPEYRKDKVNV
ncbi:MAG: peptide deformylase [Spirochaetia bacterium]|nr:peptide deformylase [Spirochaetia bacterium]